jgi:hypothetical protein
MNEWMYYLAGVFMGMMFLRPAGELIQRKMSRFFQWLSRRLDPETTR